MASPTQVAVRRAINRTVQRIGNAYKKKTKEERAKDQTAELQIIWLRDVLRRRGDYAQDPAPVRVTLANKLWSRMQSINDAQQGVDPSKRCAQGEQNLMQKTHQRNT